MKFSDLRLEHEASGAVVVTGKLIDSYAEISRDYNPIHMDDAAAIQTGFAGRIAHGLLCEAEVSRILGTEFPGEGTVLLQENFKFVGPVYIGDRITTRIWITELIPEKKRAGLDFECTNQNAKPVMTGNALIKLTN
ncbi:MAG TPA: MaoC family dehydratase [Anaerolineaceae bacterium]|nr:MaoC family dehydratase [Anaerolineaceae bacterium]